MIQKIYILLAIFLYSNAYAQSVKSSFAIVIDNEHYQQLSKEISAYRSILLEEGLNVHLVIEQDPQPENIRQYLHKLYTDSFLEGAVFIGNIPVPMIRDAQHLTSTFKMPQQMDWIESSVPSDRFYDDFDLKFEFIKKDEENKLLYYYKLLPESDHAISMDIYSGRIKAPATSIDESVAYIRKYLNKLVSERQKNNPLSHVLAFTGEGYNSNALNSWGSLVTGYRTQFADLYQQPNHIRFMNFRNKENIKPVLMSALKNHELDFAYLNGHGLPDEQILSGHPEVSNPQASMENVSRYVRQKIRETDEAQQSERKNQFQRILGLNDKWFGNIFDTTAIAADSLYHAQKVISIADLRSAEINARLVYLDACLTGSFQLNDYLAAHYPFGNGQNIAAIANSVGVLQDLWANQLIGLLQFGTRVGNILKHTAYLETHIFGDPTFFFNYKEDVTVWNNHITHNKNIQHWKKQLSTPHPDIQALALTKISQLDKKEKATALLRNYFYNSSLETVRTTCFLLLKKIQPADWYKIVIDASQDNFEYLRRIAITEMGEIGHPSFIQPMIELYFQDRHTNRTVFNVERVMLFFDKESVLTAIDSAAAHQPIFDRIAIEELKEKVSKESFFDKAYLDLNKSQTTNRQAGFAITIMRAYRFHQYVPVIIEFIRSSLKNEEQLIPALEALSWFNRSVQKKAIIEVCQEVIDSKQTSEKARQEAFRTKKILQYQ
ncbi:HEAT repeat domain-containing protein [Gynurincola endophyticus]|uniref:HEAT repeat domain-containing protein n=1 Tax=Gynurincola endophyticus TaxID=2479004 RepID=UPI000F8DC687|nr:hypothetical protein [Gynurincola endophyticus]